MAISSTLTLLAPQGDSTLTVDQPAHVNISKDNRFPARMTVTIATNWDDFKAESNQGPAQANAYATLWNPVDGFLFRGAVDSVQRTIVGAQPYLVLVCYDKSQVGVDTVAMQEPGSRYDLTSANTGTSQFTLNGVDATGDLTTGAMIYVSFNGDNDGPYTVASANYSGGNTIVTVNEQIPSATGGGYIQLWPLLIWQDYTPSLQVTNADLYPGVFYDNGFRDVWWLPASETNAWLPDGSCAQSTLGDSMPNNDDPIPTLKLSQTPPNFLTTGFVKIGSEVCQFNGCIYNDADGYFYLHDVRRARLGTGYAAHSPGATVINIISRRVHFDTPVLIEGYTGSAYEPIPEADHFEVNVTTGSINFSQDPLTMRGNGLGYASVRAKQIAFYDETGSGKLTLAQVITSVYEANPELGGPGFRSGYTDTCRVDVSDLPEIVLTSVRCDHEQYADDFITRLLSETDLRKGTDTDLVLKHYNSRNDRMTFKGVQQIPDDQDADRYYDTLTSQSDVFDLSDAKTLVYAAYTQGADTNLFACERFWNTPAGDQQIGAVTPPYAYVLEGGVWQRAGIAFPGSFNISKSTGALGSTTGPKQRLTDNDPTSGIAVCWDTAPAAGIHFYAWFPGVDNVTPDMYLLRNLAVVLEGVGISDAAARFGVTLYYYTEFTGSTSTTPPTAGTPHFLGRAMARRYGEGTMSLATIPIESPDGMLIRARAIGIKIEGYLQGSQWDDRFGVAILDMRATGSTEQQALAMLKAQYSAADRNTVTAMQSTRKLRNSSMGQHKVQLLNVGPGTRESAAQLAQTQLVTSLLLTAVREVEIDTDALDQSGVADVGETVEFADGFRGICDSWTYDEDGPSNTRSLSLRVINFNAGIVGREV